MHVPAVVNWPGRIPGGKFIDEIVMTADILPTVCQLTRTQVPSGRTIDGRNIWPVLTQGAPSPHQYVCWSEGPQLAIRRGKWKLVLNGVVHDGTPAGESPLKGEDAVFLSNVENDPGESRNLRHEYPEIADELLTLAQGWKRDIQQN